MSLIQNIESLVAIDSVFPNEKQIALYLEKLLTKSKFKVKRQQVSEGRFNLLATKGKKSSGHKAILFYGHMDTVPLVNEAEWKTDPFKAIKKGNKLFGLGVSDMKASIAAFIEASVDTERYIKVFLSVDEENISRGAWKAVQEKPDFFQDVELVISAEPNFGNGVNSITVGRTGRCIFEVSFLGTPKHIIQYKEAKDAIKEFSDFANKLYQKRNSLFHSPDTVVQIRKVVAEAKGMSVPGDALAEVEVLIGFQDSIDTIEKKLQSLTPEKVKLKFRETPYLEGYQFLDFPYKDEISKLIKLHTGKKVKFINRKSVADDNVLATMGIPVITWGPDGGNQHAANEYVEIDSLLNIVSMYKDLL